MEFREAAKRQIDQLYEGRKHVELTGYDKKDQPCRCWQWEKTDAISLAGALNSKASDLLDFARKNLDGSLPYLAMCHEVHGPCEKNADSGLAWRLEKDCPISWHTGSAGAFSAWLGLNRETGTAVRWPPTTAW